MIRLRLMFRRVFDVLRRHLDRELELELETLHSFEYEENLRRGLDPDEARRQANLRIGRPGQIREQCHDTGGFPQLESWIRDIRYGLRALARHRSFTA